MAATENEDPMTEPEFLEAQPRKKRRGLFLAMGVGVGVLALIAVAFAWVLGRGVTETATMDQMVVPEGWTTGAAPSGDFAFAYSPRWIDFYSEEGADIFAAYSSPGFVSELGGNWITTGGADYPTMLRVFGQTHTESTRGVRDEVDRVVAGGEDDSSAYSYEVVRDEGIGNPLGFSGWYKVYGVPSQDGQLLFFRGAIGISNGNTVVFAYVESWHEPAEWEADLKDLARSIVILHSVHDIKGS